MKLFLVLAVCVALVLAEEGRDRGKDRGDGGKDRGDGGKDRGDGGKDRGDGGKDRGDGGKDGGDGGKVESRDGKGDRRDDFGDRKDGKGDRKDGEKGGKKCRGEFDPETFNWKQVTGEEIIDTVEGALEVTKEVTDIFTRIGEDTKDLGDSEEDGKKKLAAAKKFSDDLSEMGEDEEKLSGKWEETLFRIAINGYEGEEICRNLAPLVYRLTQDESLIADEDFWKAVEEAGKYDGECIMHHVNWYKGVLESVKEYAEEKKREDGPTTACVLGDLYFGYIRVKFQIQGVHWAVHVIAEAVARAAPQAGDGSARMESLRDLLRLVDNLRGTVYKNSNRGF